MKKNILPYLLVGVMTLCLTALPAGARKGGFGQPSGWGRGEKQNWQNSIPPGLEDKEPSLEKQREKIRRQQEIQRRDRNRERVRDQERTHQGQTDGRARENGDPQQGGLKNFKENGRVEKETREKKENRVIDAQERQDAFRNRLPKKKED